MSSDDIILCSLKSVAVCVAKTLGSFCEVVIHDLRTREIVAIENGHITGRKVGDKLQDKLYNYLVKIDEEGRNMIGYPSRIEKNSRMIKSSTLIIRGVDNKLLATFCINLDVGQLKSALDILNIFVDTKPIGLSNEKGNNTMSILDITKIIISDAIQKVGKPLPLSSKEGKLKILRELNQQGIFLVKNVVPSICDVLSISQATLYNYLHEIRKEDSEPLFIIK